MNTYEKTCPTLETNLLSNLRLRESKQLSNKTNLTGIRKHA